MKKAMWLLSLLFLQVMQICFAEVEQPVAKVEYHGLTKKQQSLFSQYLEALSRDIDETGIQASQTEVVYILKKLSEKQQLKTTIYIKDGSILLFNNHDISSKNSAW